MKRLYKILSQKYIFKIKILKFFLIFFIFSFVLLFYLKPLLAADMQSSQYQMKYVNINMGADVYHSESATLSATLGQLAAEKFNSSGYIVKAGFQYFYSIVPFSFSISNTRIDFGDVVANIPATSSATLSVSFGGAGQYQVTAIENGQMQTLNGENKIADTDCDTGCDETTAKPWVLSTTEGFGYKMSGEDIPTTFLSCGDTCYRRFPDALAYPTPEDPAVVMSNTNVTVDLTSKPKDIIHQSTITFKLNVKPEQAAGTYQTIINFVATPSY